MHSNTFWISYIGVSFLIHYLDDFLTAGGANSQECTRNLELIMAICEWLGVPLKAQKIVGPATVIIFLGIELDTVKQEIRIPPTKLRQLVELLAQWETRKHCQKRELLPRLQAGGGWGDLSPSRD